MRSTNNQRGNNMGASVEFYKVKAKNVSDLQVKYAELVQDALYDHGHLGYSGSIAESGGLRILTISMTEDEAEDYIEKNAQKWGDTLAIPVKEKEDVWVLGGCYSC